MEELAAYLGPAIQAHVACALWKSRGPELPLREHVNERARQVFAALFAGGARLLREWQPEHGLSLRDFVLFVSKLAEAADPDDELLERYALGEVTPSDRRELERRASSDRGFADRVELYRPLDTYERRVLADHARRDPSAPKTRRRPFLVTFGAVASAALGVGLIARGCRHEP